MARKTTTTTTTPPVLPETPVLDGDELGRARAWFEDKVVREVRAAGHCTEALAILDRVFGGPRPGVQVYDTRGAYGSGSRLCPAYVDSDGVDCWGNEWRDADGFNAKGFDTDGYDREGFNAEGRDKLGFDREGKDAQGIHKDDPARYRFNRQGWDADGYNRAGYNRDGYNREGLDRQGNARPASLFSFDAQGYNARGYSADGYNRQGRYSEEEYLLARGMDRTGRPLPS